MRTRSPPKRLVALIHTITCLDRSRAPPGRNGRKITIFATESDVGDTRTPVRMTRTRAKKRGPTWAPQFSRECDRTRPSSATRCAGTRQSPFWIEDAPGDAYPTLTADTHCDLAVVGGGYSGLWTALLAKRENPVAAGRAARGQARSAGPHPVATAASAKRASPTATRTASAASRRSSTALQELGRANLDEIERDRRTSSASTATSSATARSTSPTEPHQVEWMREGAERRRRRLPRHGCGARAGRTPPPSSPACCAPATRPSSTPRSSPVALARACADARRRDPRAHARDGLDTGSLTVAQGAELRTPHGTVRARKVALATNVFPSLLKRNRLADRSRLRLRAHDRTADGCAARLDRLGGPAGPRRLREPVPLLPAEPRQPHPLGRLRRDLPLRRPGARRVRGPPRDVPAPGEPLLHDVPAARGHPLHAPMGGRHRHLQPLLRLLRHVRATAASPTRPASPASGSHPPTSAPR